MYIYIYIYRERERERERSRKRGSPREVFGQRGSRRGGLGKKQLGTRWGCKRGLEGYGLRFSTRNLREQTGENSFPRISTGILFSYYRKLRKSPETSGSLRDNYCNLGIMYSRFPRKGAASKVRGVGMVSSSWRNIYIYIYIYIYPVRNPRFVSFRTQLLENLSAAVKLPINKKVSGQPNPWNKSWIMYSCYANWVYGLRFSTEIYGSKREKMVFREYLQVYCFVLTEISEHLWKPPGVYGIMQSRNPVLQLPLTSVGAGRS